MSNLTIGRQFTGLDMCPHCSISNPHMNCVWDSEEFIRSGKNVNNIINRGDGLPDRLWVVYCCSTCGSLVSVLGGPIGTIIESEVFDVFPLPKKAHDDLPERAKKYLQQAYNTLHAPDAAAVVAASAVDSMLKELGYKDGTLNQRIDKTVNDNVLTKNMADWAHRVRLEANRTRHADEDEPFVTNEQARQVVEFAEALGQFLFILPARMKKSLEN